ncbi:IucA/IucC family protein [Streptomyces alkaliphilus]|uniref:IucA/IucC family protein n=1 Tax=Streptomyces alkaliphilus TaxID=1472722 RepID=UPI001562F720|nr:IucA/IucC family protein [Streptomyces alkaliphilus]
MTPHAHSVRPNPELPRPGRSPETGTGTVRDEGTLPPDPLEHPDADRAADAAAVENLLRCWLRETDPDGVSTGVPNGDDGDDGEDTAVLTLPLPATGTRLRVPLTHRSPTGHHRFGTPVLEGVPEAVAAPDAVTLAALLAREAVHRATGRTTGQADGRVPGPAAATELVGRVADSARRVAAHLTDRRAEPAPPPGTPPFLDAEQALVLGHPLHPTPKSREGLTGHEAVACSPESRGSFPLHWFAVDPKVLASGSSLEENGRTVPAEEVVRSLAGPLPDAPAGTIPLPLHPWQARDLPSRPATAALMEAGLLHDLGPHGAPWFPTSSVRTVFRADAPVMLKLSLGLRITNSRRENLRKEMLRGREVHRLLEAGAGARWRAATTEGTGFDVLRDPAWLGVDTPDGTPVTGLDTALRLNPFGAGQDVACLAGLLAPRPWPGRPAGELRSRLGVILEEAAARTGRSIPDTAAEWLRRHLRTVVAPVLWLDAVVGVALEAHQQNTLVRLDSEGFPDGGWYRDNQGYYFRESRREELDRLLPGIGVESDTFVTDAVTDERFSYYLGINHILGLVGAMGSQRLLDEDRALRLVADFLRTRARPEGDRPASTTARRLLELDPLPCKANLLTRVHDMDELEGPVDGQSVYVPWRNPLVGAGRGERP